MYTAEQQDVAPTQALAAGSGLTRVSYRRSFLLSPSVTPTGFSGYVTLSFGPDDFVNFPNDNSFVVAKNDAPNAAWANAGRLQANAPTSGGAPVSGTITSALFNAFTPGSSFTLASTSPATVNGFPGLNPLPVELTTFGADVRGAAVSVAWATASEKNSARFEVQRSAVGEVFETIGSVKVQGSTTAAHRYAFLDSRPLTGVSYYRLRQVDADGTAAYSPVATVRRALEARVFPNPTAGYVELPAGAGAVRYRVLNAVGQVLLNGQAAGGEHLDLSALPHGPLFLELSSAAGRTIQRLLHE